MLVRHVLYTNGCEPALTAQGLARLCDGLLGRSLRGFSATGDSLELALVGASGLSAAAGVVGPTEHWAWLGVRVYRIKQPQTKRSGTFYGLLSVGFGCGVAVASLVL